MIRRGALVSRCNNLNAIIITKTENNMALRINESIFVIFTNRRQTITKPTNIIPLAFSDNVAVQIDKTAFIIFYDESRPLTIGQNTIQLGLETNDDVALRINQSVFPIFFDRCNAFVKISNIIPSKINSNVSSCIYEAPFSIFLNPK